MFLDMVDLEDNQSGSFSRGRVTFYYNIVVSSHPSSMLHTHLFFVGVRLDLFHSHSHSRVQDQLRAVYIIQFNNKRILAISHFFINGSTLEL